SSAQVAGSVISMAYAQAGATARIDILSHAVVEGAGSVHITSEANAAARVEAETEREEPGPVLGFTAKQSQNNSFAASLAITNATVDSKTTVFEDAVVHGGRTVNVRALGDVESEAASESGLFADGTAALALALQFSNADIKTTLAGTVTA